MAVFGGKKVHQIVAGFGGSGLGQVVITVAVSFLVRVLSAPGPAILPENDADDVPENDSGDAEAPIAGKVTPVTISWRNINCSVSDKSSKSVSSCFLLLVNAKVMLIKLDYKLWIFIVIKLLIILFRALHYLFQPL